MSLLINETRYARILGSDGGSCSSTRGKLDVNVHTPVHHGELTMSGVDIHSASKVSIYGRTTKSVHLMVQVSGDLQNWFTAETFTISGDFHIFFQTSCRYIRILNPPEEFDMINYSAKH